jgi:hypothetical protein
MHGDRISDSAILETVRMAFLGQTPTDVWDDNDVINFLKSDQQPADPKNSNGLLGEPRLTSGLTTASSRS